MVFIIRNHYEYTDLPNTLKTLYKYKFFNIIRTTLMVAGTFLVEPSGVVRAAFAFRQVPEHWSKSAAQARVARFQVRVEDVGGMRSTGAGANQVYSDSALVLVSFVPASRFRF